MFINVAIATFTAMAMSLPVVMPPASSVGAAVLCYYFGAPFRLVMGIVALGWVYKMACLTYKMACLTYKMACFVGKEVRRCYEVVAAATNTLLDYSAAVVKQILIPTAIIASTTAFVASAISSAVTFVAPVVLFFYKMVSELLIGAEKMVLSWFKMLVSVGTLLSIATIALLVVRMGCPSLDAFTNGFYELPILPRIFSEWTLTWGLASILACIFYQCVLFSNPVNVALLILAAYCFGGESNLEMAAFGVEIARNTMIFYLVFVAIVEAFATLAKTARGIFWLFVSPLQWVAKSISSFFVVAAKESKTTTVAATKESKTTTVVATKKSKTTTVVATKKSNMTTASQTQYFTATENMVCGPVSAVTKSMKQECGEYGDFCFYTHQATKTKGCECDFCIWIHDPETETAKKTNKKKVKKIVEDDIFSCCEFTGKQRKTRRCKCDYCLWL